MTRARTWTLAASCLLTCSLLSYAGCGGSKDGPTPTSSATSAIEGPPPQAAAITPVTLSGNAVAPGADDRTMLVADEDHEAVFVVPTGFEPDGVRVVAMPGPPAQIVDAGDAVFVTIRTLPTADAREARNVIKGPLPTREGMKVAGEIKPRPSPSASGTAVASAPPAPPPSASASASASAKASASSGPASPSATASVKAAPKKERGTRPLMFDPSIVRKSEGGLLLVLRRDAEAGLVEVGRVVLPPDAWGLALTPDRKRAVVTSAWSASVSVVDVADRAKPAVVRTLESAREPRGVAITKDGSIAYVSHLVGSQLTRVDGLAGAEPSLSRVDLPAARSRTPATGKVTASLGYAVVISPDGRTLYAPRHAIGAQGVASWWGAPTVDTMDVASQKPLQPEASKPPKVAEIAEDATDYRQPVMYPPPWLSVPELPPDPEQDLVQPRAAIYRASKHTLLVASEGMDKVVELDARFPDPAMGVVNKIEVGGAYALWGDFAEVGGAPTGLALSRDEASLYVFCRSTFDLIRIDFAGIGQKRIHLADDGLPVDAAYGRRLYYNARSTTLSGGMGCAACHPDGRDDGYVWREAVLGAPDGSQGRRFVASRALLKIETSAKDPSPEKTTDLMARQTPMLAGRMRANGPYAWHGEDKDLLARLESGFALHRAGWQFSPDIRSVGPNVAKVDYIADFLRSGLLPPPTLARELSDLEKRGREVFTRESVACASCHLPASELTDRSSHKLEFPPVSAEFFEESHVGFKTPSLMFVSGTAPYFHDGSAATLEELVEKNGKRMGDTSKLDAEDKKALVAFLETL